MFPFLYLHVRQQQLIEEAKHDALEAKSDAARQSERIRALEISLNRVTLISQAVWELLRERTSISEAELTDKILEIDLRDGRQDGAFSPQVLQCPKCARTINSKRARCIYRRESTPTPHVYRRQ